MIFLLNCIKLCSCVQYVRLKLGDHKGSPSFPRMDGGPWYSLFCFLFEANYVIIGARREERWHSRSIQYNLMNFFRTQLRSLHRLNMGEKVSLWSMMGPFFL